MSDDAPKRINDPTSASSAFARDLVSAAKQDAPAASAKAAARAKFERFLASESSVMTKNPETDMPLFGSTVDVLETAAKSPVPSATNTTSEPNAASAQKNDFFAKAIATPAPPAAGASSSAATGARNENSALFSLASLSGGEETKPKPKSEAGVIDIKSLSTGASAVDEILSVAGGGLASPLAAPVLAPVPAPTVAAAPEAKQKVRNNTVVASVLGASIILVGGGLGAVFLLKSGQQPTQVGAEGSGPNTANANGQGTANNPTNNANPNNNGQGVANNPNLPNNGAGTVPNSGTAGAQPAGTGTQPAGTGAHGPSGTAPSTGHSEPSGRGERSARSPRNPSPSGPSAPSSQNNNSPPAGPSTGPAAPAANTCAVRCRGDIACLVQCGTSQNRGTGQSSGPTPTPASSGNLPAAPQRADVSTAMRSVQSAVRACSAGQTGTAMISVTFASSGRVTTAVVDPPFAGTPMGSCMARAVRAATVPAFSQPTFRVQYPFVL